MRLFPHAESQSSEIWGLWGSELMVLKGFRLHLDIDADKHGPLSPHLSKIPDSSHSHPVLHAARSQSQSHWTNISGPAAWSRDVGLQCKWLVAWKQKRTALMCLFPSQPALCACTWKEGGGRGWRSRSKKTKQKTTLMWGFVFHLSFWCSCGCRFRLLPMNR